VARAARRNPPGLGARRDGVIGADELTGDLAAAGLRFGRWLTEDQAWFTARPAP
jgi:hypothetical protein